MGDAPLRDLTDWRDTKRRSRPSSSYYGTKVDDGAKQLRNRKALVSLDDNEHTELSAAAAAERMPLSTWLRVAALRVARAAAGAGLSPAAPGTKPSAAARTLPLRFEDEDDPEGVEDIDVVRNRMKADGARCIDCDHADCPIVPDCLGCWECARERGDFDAAVRLLPETMDPALRRELLDQFGTSKQAQQCKVCRHDTCPRSTRFGALSADCKGCPVCKGKPTRYGPKAKPTFTWAPCDHGACDHVDCRCIDSSCRGPCVSCASCPEPGTKPTSGATRSRRSSSPTTSTSRTKPTKAPARSRRTKSGGRKPKAASGPRGRSKR